MFSLLAEPLLQWWYNFGMFWVKNIFDAVRTTGFEPYQRLIHPPDPRTSGDGIVGVSSCTCGSWTKTRKSRDESGIDLRIIPGLGQQWPTYIHRFDSYTPQKLTFHVTSIYILRTFNIFPSIDQQIHRLLLIQRSFQPGFDGLPLVPTCRSQKTPFLLGSTGASWSCLTLKDHCHEAAEARQSCNGHLSEISQHLLDWGQSSWKFSSGANSKFGPDQNSPKSTAGQKDLIWVQLCSRSFWARRNVKHWSSWWSIFQVANWNLPKRCTAMFENQLSASHVSMSFQWSIRSCFLHFLILFGGPLHISSPAIFQPGTQAVWVVEHRLRQVSEKKARRDTGPTPAWRTRCWRRSRNVTWFDLVTLCPQGVGWKFLD